MSAKSSAQSSAGSAPVIRVGLIGHGIQKSRSPAMHVGEGRAQGFDYSYTLFDPEVMDGPDPALATMLAEAEAAGFAGVNITHPYKKAVIALLDELSAAARNVGAVNTVLFRDGKRFGHNTDFWGFAESLRRNLADALFDSVLLLGAGGAGGAVAHALKSVGVERLMIADRDAAMAQALARATGGMAVADLVEAAAKANGIVNATPMGMTSHPGMAIAADLITPRHWVADIVYFPLETELLRTAHAKGCRVMNGSGMAVFQAVRAFELFSGRPADPERMRTIFESFDSPGQ